MVIKTSREDPKVDEDTYILYKIKKSYMFGVQKAGK